MKYNKHNIITDEDIILKDFDTNLGDTLKHQQNEIDALKSNVKWMYKYGALGSGTAVPGTTPTSSFRVLVYKDGNTVVKSGSTLFYPEPGTRKITVQILNGGTATYNIQYSYNDNKKTSEIVSPNNAFTSTKNLAFTKNSTLNIIVTNQDTGEVYVENDSAVLSFPYIVTAYKFDSYYVKGNNVNTTEDLPKFTLYDNSIFINEVASTGVMLALKYNIAVELNEDATILYYDDFNGNRITMRGVDTRISKGVGTLYFALDQNILEYLSDNANATYKNVEIGLQITLANNTEPETEYVNNLNVNLIPNGLYLKVTTTGGKLLQKTTNNASTIVDTVNEFSESDKFNPGNIIFNIIPYYDSLDSTRVYDVVVSLYNVDINDGEITETLVDLPDTHYQPKDQEYKRISIPCGNGGVKKIVFVLSCLGQSVQSEYYIHVKTFESHFNWYPNDKIPNYSAYYRYSLESHNININENKLIERNINSNITRINLIRDNSVFNATGAANINDVCINIGIQYGKSNDYTKPILSINAQGSTDSTIAAQSIIVYQDKIVVTSGVSNIINGELRLGTVISETEIFIPLIELINPTQKEKYHLLSIYKRLEAYENNNYWRGLYAFIDGALDGALGSFNASNVLYDSITLYNANYNINLLDVSLWSHSEDNSSMFLEDNDVTCFWYTFNERMRSSGNIYTEDDIALYELFTHSSNGFEYDEQNNIIFSNGDLASDIAEHIDLPVMMIDFEDSTGATLSGFTGWNKDNFKEFLDGRYGEEDPIPEKIPVTIKYSQGLSELSQITMPGTSIPAEFYLDLQGSSTRSYKCKNFELNAPVPQESDTHITYVYSPNNDPDTNNTEAFLPEHSFTLKADVVDSSHTNNNAIGKFVDENTTQFIDAEQNDTIYKNRIKNCLTGFPILLFLSSTYFNDENKQQSFTNYYFLGIYNFNLGRKSAYNMGYKAIHPLDDIIQNSSAGFTIFEIPSVTDEYLPYIQVAEIQGNNKHFDFSQYHESVLFKLSGLSNDLTYMWGDFISNKTVINQNDLQDNIKTLVENVAKSGGYIFNKIGKYFSDLQEGNYGYDDMYSHEITYITQQDGKRVPIVQVPNFRYQYEREIVDGTLTTRYNDQYTSGITNDVLDGLQNILVDTILSYIDDEYSNTPLLDYRSLTEYFTTCMAFALVDNVMKNLNVKSWKMRDGKPRWYVALYDMDCGFGKNNAGNRINYFAFSDYWKSTTTKDALNNNVLSEIEIYRDWAPHQDEKNSTFFDVPSSYLFAIAKYALTILIKQFEGSNYGTAANELKEFEPSNIWAKWRKENGPLRNAKYVVDTYFAHHLDNVPECAFNLNYRYKYFVKTPNENNTAITSFNAIDFQKFHGKSVAYTEYWLDGRFHILDAYFDVVGFTNILAPSSYDAPCADSVYRPVNNSDVYLLRDIFGAENTGIQYPNGTGSIMITALPLSPLFINGANFKSLYLFPETSTPCKIIVPISGIQTVMYGGSMMWTDCDSINFFIGDSHTLSISSKYLTNINGNDRVINGISMQNFNVPAIKNIVLTSPGYTGTLIIDSNSENQYSNLTKIDLSNSNISLIIDNVPLRQLYMTNKPGGILRMTNMTLIENVVLGGAFDELTLNSWSTNSQIGVQSPVTCKQISVTNILSRFEHAAITIANNSTLESVTLSDFTNVTIYNCPKLKEIIINDTSENHNLLEKIQVTMPTSTNKTHELLTLNIAGQESVSGVIDLRSFDNLKTIQFTNCNIKEIHIGDNCNIELPANAFQDCDQLEYIYTGENTKLFITGVGTFQKCSSLNYHYTNINDETVYVPIHVKDGTTDLSSTFSCNGALRGKFDISDCKKFFDTIVDDIETVTVSVGGNTVHRPPTRLVSLYNDMFNNQNIVYTKERGWSEYKQQKCSIQLGLFLAAKSTIDTSLSGNDIQFVNRYMFKTVKTTNNETFDNTHAIQNIDMDGKNCYIIGINNNSTNRATISIVLRDLGTPYMTIDALWDIITRCTFLNAPQSTFTIVSNTEDTFTICNNVKINDIFTPASTISYYGQNDMFANNIIQEINNFNLTQSFVIDNVGQNVIFDFSELFNSPKYDYANHIITNEYGNKWSYADRGISLYRFMQGTYKIDSWNNVNYLLSNCVLGTKIYDSFGGFITDNPDVTAYNALDIYTFIDWENNNNHLNTIKTLFHTESLYDGAGTHGQTSGLSMKKFVSYRNMQRIVKSLLTTEKLENVGALFNNCTVVFESPDNHNINFKFIENDDLISIPENKILKSISGLFANMTISADGTLSNSQPIKVDHDLMKPFKNVKSFVSTFENWYFKYPLSFDFFNKRNYEATSERIALDAQDINGNTITNVYRNVFTYRNDMIDTLNCFNNVKFATKSAFKINGIYDDSDFNVNFPNIPNGVTIEQYIESIKNKYTYQLNGNSVSSNQVVVNGVTMTIEQSYEIIDAQNAEQSDYSINTTNANTLHFGNMIMSNIDLEKLDSSGCFISPDILYGISPTGFFDNMFVRSSSYKDNDYYTFTGTIPAHMMKNLMNRTFTNLFTGLNITPIYRNEYDNNGYKHYVFIPDNFSNATDFSESFRFNMLLPRNDGNDKEFFTLLTDKSLPNMTKLSSAMYTLRYDCDENLISGASTLANVHTQDYYARFNIMCSKNNDVVQYGIDATKFVNMRYDYLLNSIMVFIYYGDVILNDAIWNKNKLYSDTSCLYAITALNAQFYNTMNASRNIIMTTPNSNENYFGINATVTLNVYRGSLPNCSNSNDWTGENNAFSNKLNIVE